jgi:hypothetical protein
MLTRLYIDNFRTFRNFELKLQPLTLLVGRNGSGKTAVFDVLEKLRRFVVDEEPAAAVFLSRDLPAWNGDVTTQSFAFDWEYAMLKVGYRLTIEFDSTTRKAQVLHETFIWHGETLAEYKDGQLSFLDQGAAKELVPLDGKFLTKKSVLAVGGWHLLSECVPFARSRKWFCDRRRGATESPPFGFRWMAEASRSGNAGAIHLDFGDAPHSDSNALGVKT